MKKLVMASLFFVVSLGLAITSFIVGNRIALKNTRIVIDTSKLSGLSFDKSSPDTGAFCANNICSIIGVKGVIDRYDQTRKLITLSLEGRMMEVSLTNSTKVDNFGGINFFEETERLGDVIIVILESENLIEAKEIYFVKTGATPMVIR